MRRAVFVLLICVGLTFAPTAQAQAGQADEILLGFVFGTSLGILLSGALLIVYTNPEADANIETVLVIGGLTGAAGGIVFGSLLPDDAVENDPIISMKKNRSDWNVSWKPPKLSLTSLQNSKKQETGIFTNLFRLDF